MAAAVVVAVAAAAAAAAVVVVAAAAAAVGGGVLTGVQPESVAVAPAVRPPSETVTLHVSERKPVASTRKAPEESALREAVDGLLVTVTVAPAAALRPSTRRDPPLSSARETVSADALDGTINIAPTTSIIPARLMDPSDTRRPPEYSADRVPCL